MKYKLTQVSITRSGSIAAKVTNLRRLLVIVKMDGPIIMENFVMGMSKENTEKASVKEILSQ